MEAKFFPRMNRCLCCLSLRVGALIIGYGSMLASVLSMAGVSYSLYAVVTFVENNKTQPNPEHTPAEVQRYAISLYISHAYFLMVLLYYFTISLLLVIGVHKNISKYMRYYFYSALVLLVLALAVVVVTFVFFGFLATLAPLKWCVILFYCLVVVRSAYLDLEEQQKPKPLVYEMQSLYSPPAPMPTV